LARSLFTPKSPMPSLRAQLSDIQILANNLSYAVIALRTREHNRVAAEEKLRKRSEQLQKHRDVLLGLAHSDESDFPKAIRQICSVSAATLKVARVSYWSLQENGSAIACEVLYLHEPESFDEQCKGSRLGFSDCPVYFEALATKRPIVADRALEHSATCGLAEKYLKLHGISSLLHTPVWMRGEVVGVLCHEDRGPARH
jgi:hypothetical protein